MPRGRKREAGRFRSHERAGCDEGFCGICGGVPQRLGSCTVDVLVASGAHLACFSRCAREYQQKSGKVIGWHRCLVCDQPHASRCGLALAKCQWRGSISLPDKCWDKMRSLSVLAERSDFCRSVG